SPLERELLRAEAGVHFRTCRGMLHFRSRCFSDVDVARRIDRQIVGPAELSRAHAWSTEFADHLEITAAQNRDEVRPAIGDIHVGLRRVVREADGKGRFSAARPLWCPRCLLLRTAAR